MTSRFFHDAHDTMFSLNRIYCTDALSGLKQLGNESVDCVITSPPYWGLRDYGVKGQMGLEPTPEAHVAKLVEVFKEVRRVLRRTGTCWLVLGDSYFSRQNHNRNGLGSSLGGRVRGGGSYKTQLRSSDVLKPKDLCGLPWRIALALQADGWYLRAEIIWAKPNPMPESVTDRPSRAHDHVFLLTKSKRYFYDAEAVKEPVTGNAHPRGSGMHPKAAVTDSSVRQCRPRQNASFSAAVANLVTSRNLRSVWQIPARGFRGAHFATFPELLVERCLKAGTSERGCCADCGAPWVRRTARRRVTASPRTLKSQQDRDSRRMDHPTCPPSGHCVSAHTVRWRPSCRCPNQTAAPCVVLDPFMGAGTTALVAQRLGRDFIGFDLNPGYVKMARVRLGRTGSESLKGGSHQRS